MAILFSRLWTAANSTPWTDVGFVKVLGGVSVADVSSNAGHCGPTATERVYRVTGYPPSADYKFDQDLVWSNPSGSARIGGVGARWTSDGRFGYMAEIDSNLGTTMIRVRKRSAGSWSTLLGWTSISASLPSSALLAGTTIILRVENTDASTVNVKALVGATVLADVDDTSATRIEGGGTPALLIGPNATLNDIIFDNLNVKDFEDEYSGTAADLNSNVALVVDGKSYSWDDLVDAGVRVGRLRQSFTNAAPAGFTDGLQFQAASTVLYPGAWVECAIDGTVVAVGRLVSTQTMLTSQEGHAYELRSPQDLAGSVLIQEPSTKAVSVAFNVQSDHIDYVASRAGQELGEILAWIIDNHIDGDGMLRDQGAISPDGAGYVQSEFDLLTAVVPDLSVSGDVYSAFEAVLAHTDRLLFIDPITRKWRLQGRTGTKTDIDIAAEHITGELKANPTRSRTAILFYGSRPETTDVVLGNKGSGLDDGWDSGLEGTSTAEKRYKDMDTALVQSSSTAGGKGVLTVDQTGPPPFAMEVQEWVGTLVGFTDGVESGNFYTVESNTVAAMTMEGPWLSGGPGAGDTFVVQGNRAGGGRNNGHRDVGRRFTLNDLDLGIAEGLCVPASVSIGVMSIPTKAIVTTPADLTKPAELQLDLPAIGLFNAAAPPNPCDADAAPVIGDVEVTVPTYSRSDPSVPTLRRPATEGTFQGEAFSVDATKWGVEGARPGRGDYGIMETLAISVPSFRGTAAQISAYQDIGDQLLEVLSPIAYDLRITIKGKLDTQWAGMNKRVTISDGGGRTTGYESADTFPVNAVEWDPVANTTTIYAGSQGVGEYDLSALRRAFASRVKLDAGGQTLKTLEDLLGCLKQSASGGGGTDELAPTQICSDHVSIGGTSGRTLSDAMDEECAPPDIADDGDGDGGTELGCEQVCTDFPCNTVISPGNFVVNRDSAVAANPTAGEAAAWLAYILRHVGCLWSTMGGIASSHDKELDKTKLDLGKIRVQTTGLKDCVNGNDALLCAAINALDTRVTNILTWLQAVVIPTFQACLTTKVDGAGTGCPIDSCPDCGSTPCSTPPPCTWSFTESVCDPTNCAQPIPDIGGFGGCTAP